MSRKKDELIKGRSNQCDFVLLTEQMSGPGYWPYDRQICRLYPVAKAWCEANLQHIKPFPIFNQQMSLYQRPSIP